MNKISPGSLVEFIDAGKFISAYVTDHTGSRLRLLGQNGRDINLSPSRLKKKSRHPARPRLHRRSPS